MANKLFIPANAGAGSLLFPTKKPGIPWHRTPKLRVGSAVQSVLQEQIAALTVQEYITNLYLHTVLRAPTSTEMADAVAALTLGCSTGTIMDATKALIDELFESAFYVSRGRSDAEYVDDLFTAVLGREQIDHPAWVNNAGGVLGSNGSWVKSAATAWNNSGAKSSLPILLAGTGSFSAIIGAMTVVVGLSYFQDPFADQDATGARLAYGWQLNVNSWEASYILGMTGPTALTSCASGDRFGFDVSGVKPVFLKNGVAQSVPGIPDRTGDLYAAVVGFSQGAGILSCLMDPAPAGDGDYYVSQLGSASMTEQQVRDAFNFMEEHVNRVSSFCKRVAVTRGQIWPRRT